MHLRPTHTLLPLLLFAAMLLAGCHSHCDPQPQQTAAGTPGDTLARTVIVYVEAENSLSDFATADSLEIAAGLGAMQPSARVVAVIDDAHGTRLCAGTAGTPLQTVRTYTGNPTLTDSLTMLTILRDIVTTYPADNYGLVLWSHASGWVPARQARLPRRSFGIDSGRRSLADNSGTEMDITTLAQVLAQVAHFDYILFDACFMQSVEVAYELRHVADYIIASPAEIPGNGAPYHLLMPLLAAVPADAAAITDTYADYYETGAGVYNGGGTELSVVATSQMELLAEATRRHVAGLMGYRSTPDCSQVQMFAPYGWRTTFTECYDAASLMHANLPEADYAAWREVLDRAVVHARLSDKWVTGYAPWPLTLTDAANTAGIAMFVPSELYASTGWLEHYGQLAWSEAVGFASTGWLQQ